MTDDAALPPVTGLWAFLLALALYVPFDTRLETWVHLVSEGSGWPYRGSAFRSQPEHVATFSSVVRVVRRTRRSHRLPWPGDGPPDSEGRLR